MPIQPKKPVTPKVRRESKDNNYAFIDGQNLYMGTAKREVDPWKIDLARFRVYLERKYHVVKAFYFLGYLDESQQSLYNKLGAPCFAALDDVDTRRKIEMKKAP